MAGTEKAVINGGSIAKAAGSSTVRKKPSSIKEYINAYKSQFARALPAAITPERFVRMALSAVSQNPKLAECPPESFLGAMMNAAQLGLEPNTPLGQAYVIPYKGTASFQIGYRGMIDLAYRSGEMKSLQAHVVYENDTFDYRYGLEPKLEHIPARGDRGEATHVYAVFKLTNGGEGFEVMTMDSIRDHAKKFSKTYANSLSPWQTNFDEMAKKTVIKKLLKYAPLKSEFARGVVADETAPTLQMPTDANGEISLSQEYIETEAVNMETGEVIRPEQGK